MVDHYLKNLEELMDSREVPSARGLFFHETMALTLAPFTSGSAWSELPRSHNLVLNGVSEDGRADGLESARVLHYQSWLSPERRGALLAAFRRCRPDRLAWLEEKVAAGPPRARPLAAAASPCRKGGGGRPVDSWPAAGRSTTAIPTAISRGGNPEPLRGALD